MPNWLLKIMVTLDGKKVYFLMIAGILTSLVQLSGGEITLVQFLERLWVFLTGMATRSAIKKSGPPTVVK